MKAFNLTAVASLAAICVAQDSFESADFNVTEALLEHGVNVSALPELANLVERSSDSACSIAVSKSYLLPVLC